MEWRLLTGNSYRHCPDTYRYDDTYRPPTIDYPGKNGTIIERIRTLFKGTGRLTTHLL